MSGASATATKGPTSPTPNNQHSTASGRRIFWIGSPVVIVATSSRACLGDRNCLTPAGISSSNSRHNVVVRVRASSSRRSTSLPSATSAGSASTRRRCVREVRRARLGARRPGRSCDRCRWRTPAPTPTASTAHLRGSAAGGRRGNGRSGTEVTEHPYRPNFGDDLGEEQMHPGRDLRESNGNRYPPVTRMPAERFIPVIHRARQADTESMSQPTNEHVQDPSVDEAAVREDVPDVEAAPIEHPRVASTVRSASVTFPALK
ncbi:hypothetical protein NS506_06962 [Nocardia seriolae]|uniref:Uncharacterized protein n=2 Tax=Nocardia seriolae TaxID=37332 RepID=A0ABC8B4E5_9NOCA|nr:hypothetical protein NS506_06962 [Nocardia seriolae]